MALATEYDPTNLLAKYWEHSEVLVSALEDLYDIIEERLEGTEDDERRTHLKHQISAVEFVARMLLSPYDFDEFLGDPNWYESDFPDWTNAR